MYNTSGLIPAKFLTLLAHLSICILLIWDSKESVRSCLPEMTSEEVVHNHHTQLMSGLIVSIVFICFELLIFLIGLTMFDTTSAILSIGGHAGSCILLSYFILDSWQCGWFWWIFTFGSILPVLYDLFLVSDAFIYKKY